MAIKPCQNRQSTLEDTPGETKQQTDRQTDNEQKSLKRRQITI